VPDPEALLLNGVSLDELTSPARPSHYEMMRRIRTTLEAWSPALFIGYNSIGFDEEMLRQGFYQTLQPLYLTSLGGNCRADALTLVRMVAFLRPGALNIPSDPMGRPICKLADVAIANGSPATGGHTAIVDAERTLHLCRLAAAADQETWSRFQRFSTKSAVDDLLDTEDAFLCIRFRGNEADPTVSTCLGREPENANARLCLPLEPLFDRIGSSDGSDPGLLAAAALELDQPLFRVKTNGCPVLCCLDEAPEGLLDGVDCEGLLDLASSLRAQPGLCAQIIAAWTKPFETPDRPLQLEERIYEDFIPDPDLKILQDFHQAPWNERLTILRRVSDPRLRKLGQRLIFTERPDLLSPADLQRYAKAIAERVRPSEAADSPWRTLQSVGQWFADHSGEDADSLSHAYDRCWGTQNYDNR
jgi:exodeoxyribonuclease-1